MRHDTSGSRARQRTAHLQQAQAVTATCATLHQHSSVRDASGLSQQVLHMWGCQGSQTAAQRKHSSREHIISGSPHQAALLACASAGVWTPWRDKKS